MENVNSSYFDGYYKYIWKAIIPPELTVKETDFLMRHFNLQPGDKLQDLMCGVGRNAIALAEKGIEVTAIDNLADYIEEIQETVVQRKLPVKAIQADILNYKPEDIFDLAICMGNSLCFFDKGDTLFILKMVNKSLKKGGHFIINSLMLAEIAFNGFKTNVWSQVDDLKFITESKYLLQPSRIVTEHLILAPDGDSEKKTAVDYIYSIAEMDALLTEAGFVMKNVYSIPGKKAFTLGDPRAYIVAEKI